jgi:hypothetical protein
MKRVFCAEWYLLRYVPAALGIGKVGYVCNEIEEY